MFIKQYFLDDKLAKDFPNLVDIGFTAQHLVNAIYKSGWSKLNTDANNRTFCQCISSCFIRNYKIAPLNPKLNPNPSKLIKSKSTQFIDNKESYAQASKINVEDIIHIKDIYITLSPNKIVEINNIINKSSLVKPRIKMTTKKPTRKQVIIFISKINADIIGSNASFYINFINRHFKEINSNTLADFIYVEKVGIIVTTNQVTSV